MWSKQPSKAGDCHEASPYMSRQIWPHLYKQCNYAVGHKRLLNGEITLVNQKVCLIVREDSVYLPLSLSAGKVTMLLSVDMPVKYPNECLC